ncbi:hypothetical protein DL546_005433 [Coniochaeta pulveracea]|uniref:Uncharacterized protein n=1 Tax=Coniochaeta pulveracea TaxID=177199 RepID=A0A420YAP2_9PEZI|nr:hypothetical protein DL546_005433 [Coniochaeta pulveracea]
MEAEQFSLGINDAHHWIVHLSAFKPNHQEGSLARGPNLTNTISRSAAQLVSQVNCTQVNCPTVWTSSAETSLRRQVTPTAAPPMQMHWRLACYVKSNSSP